ncbi:MAG: hypothetical protein COB67_09585 [SAR324 cluster bacterium]|uniref:histidine kinase n=1 Tax=SAR324 cluster bacterium TaxID=2024889 RepID=A0A2A4T0C3_9DELT|nr:MAG: hypothetical protein COB67_09585 [SAR324 cluster bacterium]
MKQKTKKLKTILVVDDEPANLDILVDTLSQNYEVMVAVNGSNALEIVAEQQPDMILLDIMMPDIDGFQVCTMLKADAISRDIPVIFITAKTDVESILKGFQLGGFDYVTKPFIIGELLARIKNCLQIRQYQSYLRNIIKQKALGLKTVQASLEQAYRELSHLDHYKDEIIETVSHALRTPLTSILGYAEVLQDIELDQESREFSQMIMEESERLEERINLIMDLSTLKKDKKELRIGTTNFQKVLADARRKLEASHSPLQQLHWSQNDFNLEIDSERITQALVLILENACKFSQEGKILIDVNKNQEDCLVTVRDFGMGIPEDILPKVFDKFYQYRPEGTEITGIGLGLSVAKKIIECHGGKIWIEDMGDGVQVSLILPLLSK